MYMAVALGNPKAHFSFSRLTWPVDKPAPLEDWRRLLALSTPQPFQDGPLMSWIAELDEQGLGMFFAAPTSLESTLRPPTYSAMSSFCWSVRSAAIGFIAPVVMIS